MRISIVAIIGCTALGLQADQVMLQNGDRYNGKVLSVSTNSVVLQSDVIGTVTLPRAKVATVDFGTAATAPTPKPQSIILTGRASAQTNSAGEVDAQLRQLTAQTNLIQQVQGQFLQGTTPAVTAKYNQMLNDLSTGKMTMGDLRKQAKDAADQLRALEKESGDDDSGTMDMYLSVLDTFLNDTPAEAGATNASASLLK